MGSCISAIRRRRHEKEDDGVIFTWFEEDRILRGPDMGSNLLEPDGIDDNAVQMSLSQFGSGIYRPCAVARSGSIFPAVTSKA